MMARLARRGMHSSEQPAANAGHPRHQRANRRPPAGALPPAIIIDGMAGGARVQRPPRRGAGIQRVPRRATRRPTGGAIVARGGAGGQRRRRAAKRLGRRRRRRRRCRRPARRRPALGRYRRRRCHRRGWLFGHGRQLGVGRRPWRPAPPAPWWLDEVPQRLPPPPRVIPRPPPAAAIAAPRRWGAVW